MSHPPAITPREVTPWVATFWFVFSIRKFSSLAPGHSLALNLKQPDLLALHERGEFPVGSWVEDACSQELKHGQALRRSLGVSFLAASTFIIAGLVTSVLLGTVHPNLPMAWSKVLSVVGGHLAAWGTILQLGGYAGSWSGKNLYEIIRPPIFRSLFLPGLLLATVGQLT